MIFDQCRESVTIVDCRDEQCCTRHTHSVPNLLAQALPAVAEDVSESLFSLAWCGKPPLRNTFREILCVMR